MAIEVCLEHDEGNREFLAWIPDRIGCAAFGMDERAALAAVPRAAAEYDRWSGILAAEAPEDTVLVVAERVTGNEVLFERDRPSASAAEMKQTIDLLVRSRASLWDVMRAVPETALDWNPPYRRLLEWASWRTIREVLGHVAVCETHYYLRSMGHEPEPLPLVPSGSAPRGREWYAAIARDWQAGP